MRSRVRTSLLGALLGTLVAWAAASPARGEDVLVLTNGREVRGRIVEERDDAVKIDVGGGRMVYRRDQIASVVREKPPPAGAADPAGDPGPATAEVPDRREEFSLLYADGVRVGTRVFRSSRLPEGWLFEEEVVQLDAKGLPVLELRTTERADPEFRPVSFQFRETDGKAAHRTLAGEMRGGRLYLSRSREGIREKSDAAAPEGARLPFAHRESFLRSAVRSGPGEGASLEAPAFEPRTGEWTQVRYEALERRPVRVDGKSLDVRVILRKRGGKTEREWIAADLSAPMSEHAGEFLRALATSKGSVERLRESGDAERVTGADSAARTRYVDPERGYRIRKPDPSWTFELPTVRTTGAVLVVRNEPQFATVDVMIDPAAREGTTPEAAAQALQKVCRAVAPDFAVAREGFVERGGRRVWWMEATATTKGEATRTLARVVVQDGRVWRLLAACPDGAFPVLRRDFEAILDSFELL